MRKIAANLVFPISKPPVKNGYLVLSDEGEVLDVCGGGETLHEIAGLEFYSGILVPGFVIAHCRLELSHLKGQIPEGIGIPEFIKQITLLRGQNPDNIEKETEKALRYMWSQGISVLGNIITTNKTIALKRSSSMVDELITMQKNFPEIPFNELILWATLNGARALGMEAEYGSFEKGKKPGVLLITGFDFKNNRLTDSAEVARLV
ncbi:MAG: amidohydrolase family protein [Salinivirgaceae bacterium]